MIRIEVRGEIVPWARAGKAGKRHFTRSAQAAYMKGLGMMARAAMRSRPVFDGPVGLKVYATWPWPNDDRDRKIFKASRPDADNVAKIIGDALNGIVWKDDALICETTIYKRYGDMPGLLIEVWPLMAR